MTLFSSQVCLLSFQATPFSQVKKKKTKTFQHSTSLFLIPVLLAKDTKKEASPFSTDSEEWEEEGGGGEEEEDLPTTIEGFWHETSCVCAETTSEQKMKRKTFAIDSVLFASAQSVLQSSTPQCTQYFLTTSHDTCCKCPTMFTIFQQHWWFMILKSQSIINF